MAKRLTEAQKTLNKLIGQKARLVAQKSRLESHIIDTNLAITEVETQIGAIRDKVTRINLGLNEFEKSLVRGGQWLQAIKENRNRTNIGLKESKDLVDAYRQTLPNGGRTNG